MRRAGIDPGSVRTGIATADDEVPVATPLCTLEHRGLEDAVQRVAELLTREQIGLAVIGLPLSLRGQEGEAARKVRLFADRLHAVSHIPVVLWDERLSSAAATRALAEPRYNAARPRARPRASRDRGRVDRSAATLILQSYLDSQRERTWQDETKDPDGDSG
jgi:putative Holliday junction resolvase